MYGEDSQRTVARGGGAGGCRDCVGRLVMVDLPDGSRPVATLKSEFETDEVTFDQATQFLDPLNWARCSDFWCDIKKRSVSPAGVHRYTEVVSTNCPERHAAWTVEAELDFAFRRVPDVLATAEYQVGAGHPKEGDDVLVDEGSLVVRRIRARSPMLRVTTTKRVKFTHSFGGEALAMIMCPLGYADFTQALFFRCAALTTAR
jgi:hypothetical protein